MSHLYRDIIECQELRVAELRIGKPTALVLSAALTVLADNPSALSLDANGAGRNVDMPAVATAGMEGKLWIINNLTAATHALTVRDALAATIVSVPATKSAMIMVMNGLWRVLGVVA